MTDGRGFWSNDGGTTPWYELTDPAVGSQAILHPSIDPQAHDYRAVTFGVKAIQDRLRILVESSLVVDGWFGKQTDAAVRAFQHMHGLGVDGKVGPSTALELWRGLVLYFERQSGILDRYVHHYVGGIMLIESAGDSAAVGSVNPGDGGLLQFNRDEGWTSEQVFNPRWSIPNACGRFMAAMNHFDAKGDELRIDCSIAQHNSPLWAQRWYDTGQAPNDTIATYVSRARQRASTF